MIDGDGFQDQVVGDPQVRRGRGKLSLQPGQESEKRAVFVAFELKPDFVLPWSCPPARQSLGHDAMLNLPCVWVQRELGGGVERGCRTALHKPQWLTDSPPVLLAVPSLLGSMHLNIYTTLCFH